MSYCTLCGEEKPENFFTKRKDRPGKPQSHCKKCKAATLRNSRTKDKEMISSSRFNQVYASLSAQARRVYDATPILTPWSASYIYSEIQRTGTSFKDQHTVLGCLNSLIAAGLVAEPDKGAFVRTAVKNKNADLPEPEPIATAASDTSKTTETQKQTMTSPKPAHSPVAILSTLATRAKAVSDAIRKLADDIETAALEIEENISVGEAEVAKLKQFQQLLKSLS